MASWYWICDTTPGGPSCSAEWAFIFAFCIALGLPPDRSWLKSKCHKVCDAPNRNQLSIAQFSGHRLGVWAKTMNSLFPFQTHRSTGLKVTKVYKCGFKIIQNGWFQLWFCYPLLPLFFRFREFSRGPSPISVRRFSMPSRTALPFSTAAWPLWILKINLRDIPST